MPPISAKVEDLCFFDEEEGILFVSQPHLYDPFVRSYLRQISAEGVAPQVQSVALDAIEGLRRRKGDHSDDKGVVTESEMQRSASEIFRQAVKRRSSDIHIRVFLKGTTKIFFRVDGDLEQIQEQQAAWGGLLCSAIYTSMTDVSGANYNPLFRQDARVSARKFLPPGVDGIRIGTTPQVDGNVMVLRVLYNNGGQSTDVRDLGYEDDQHDMLELMKGKPTGINIIAGPTGSGKSTTLQCVLLSIHRECRGAKHIITVEDPPEYPMPGIVQTPVPEAVTEAERSAAFQAAIKATMRLDPNVIMIGEIRDTPSARLSVQAAMTGHQVWTTLHANNALAILDRMIDMDIPLSTMTDPTIITGLICQRLLKVLCKHCRIPFAANHETHSESEYTRLRPVIDADAAYVMGSGCEHCNGRGVKGRVAISEVVVPSIPMMNALRAGRKDDAFRIWRAAGGRTVLDLAISKINQGLVDPFHSEPEVGLLDVERAVQLQRDQGSGGAQ